MCWFCGIAIDEEEPLGRSLRCAKCGKDLRSCRNCRFYLAGSRGDCSESGAEPPPEKERANFCDWFSLNPKYRSATEGQGREQEKALAAKTTFDNLFK
jgi:predicted amidophosphoribosyltransferase